MFCASEEKTGKTEFPKEAREPNHNYQNRRKRDQSQDGRTSGNETKHHGTERNRQSRPARASARTGTETEEKTAYGEKFTEKTARRDQTGPKPGPGPGRKDKRHRNIPTERNGTLSKART